MGSKSSPTRTASSPSPSRISVKKEASEEGIKDFAETAMNELLGWYGYERLELRRWAAARPARSPAAPDDEAAKETDECSWCNNPITTETGALHQSGSKFCSELCFSQSRRATFKRAKTCDWCRHVRHTVAYVDFQDGATQLQFCSDKCLNQYKMHIFCRETQAHLDLNPHLVNASSTSNLITPDLWLRNCKSRSVSPNSERSVSPTAENLVQAPAVGTMITDKPSPSNSPPRRKSPPPVITVAPTSKLLKNKKATSEDRISLRNSPESKREGKHPKVLGRKRHNSRCSATVTSQTARQLTNSSAAKAQDLRLCSPVSNIDSSPPLSIPVTPNARLTSPNSNINNRIPNVPNSNFREPLYTIPPPGYMEPFPNHYNDPRMPRPFFHPPSNFIPAMPPNMFHQERPKLQGIPPLPQLGMNQPPPVTILVPYPIVLPVPLPIPVPIPLLSLFQALCGKSERKNDIVTDNGEESEGPLDFTVNVNKSTVDEVRQANAETESPLNIISNNDESCNEPNIAMNDPLPFVQPTESKPDDPEHANPEHDLPRFKITRLGAKMAKIISKPRENSEFTRPLRKRRRLVNVPSDEEHSTLLAKTQKTVHV